MDFSRRFILPFAALFQIAGSAAPQILGWGTSIGERSRALDTAIVPAGWAFSIWGLIFLWCLIFAIYAATRPFEPSSRLSKVTWPAIGAFTMNGIWALYTPFMGLNLGSEIIIVIGLVSALFAAVLASRVAPTSLTNRLLVAGPLGLLAGWLTAASFVGGSSVLLGLGVAMTDATMTSILAGATIFAALVIVLRPAITYPLAVIWALSAIISKNIDGGNDAIIYAAAGAILLIFIVTLAAHFSKKSLQRKNRLA